MTPDKPEQWRSGEPQQVFDAENVERAVGNGRETAVRAVLRHARRLIVLVVGTTVLLFGIVLLVTPGPAFIVIPIGLAILGIEFAWAKHLLRRVREGVRTGMDWRDREEWKWMAGLRKHRRRRSGE